MPRLSELEQMIPKLRRYARGLAGRAAIADDLVQDAVLAALRSKGMGRGAALLHRLYAIVTDFNRLRIADRNGEDDYVTDLRGAVVALRQGAFRSPARTPPPPHRLPADPLAAMPLEEREALLLVVIERLDYDTAAGIAGISPLALVARLTSARSRMAASATAGSASMPRLQPTAHRHLRVVT
ncbi:MAG: RNA polymerase sigma factor [Beijerinckiaceae bacterium]